MTNNSVLITIENSPVTWDGVKLEYTAKLAIDADGANGQAGGPCAYGPNNSGLDLTANAGKPGNWWALVTDRYGKPIIQDGGETQPAKGMFISTTTYVTDPKLSHENAYRYVDSWSVPFIVVPPQLRSMIQPIVLGCKAVVTNLKNGMISDAVVADTGPRTKIGEGSMKLAMNLGIDHNPRKGGVSDKIIKYEIYPNIPAQIEGKVYHLQSA